MTGEHRAEAEIRRRGIAITQNRRKFHPDPTMSAPRGYRSSRPRMRVRGRRRSGCPGFPLFAGMTIRGFCERRRSGRLCRVGNCDHRLLRCVGRIDREVSDHRQDADKHDEHRGGGGHFADHPCRFAAVGLIFVPGAQMPTLQFFEGIEVGIMMFPGAAIVRRRMKTHQVLDGAKHDGLQSVASFAVRVMQTLKIPFELVKRTHRGMPSLSAMGTLARFSGLNGMMERVVEPGCEPDH